MEKVEFTIMGNGIKIYENGKLVRLSGAQLKSYLSSLRGNDIKNLELLPQATAGYDAEVEARLFLLLTGRRNMSTDYQVMWAVNTNGKARIYFRNLQG